MRRSLITSALAVALVAGLSAALVPLRQDLSIATIGLIMVVPVVGAVVAGGYIAGVVGVVAGFVAWDLVFIPPYYTLNVGAGQNWVALAVYAVVMLLVAQVVNRLQSARREAHARAVETRRLFELSELLVADKSMAELLDSIVAAVQNVFGLEGVALLLPNNSRLQVVAAVGDPPEVADLESSRPVLAHSGAAFVAAGTSSLIRTVALSAAGRPVGVLALRGGPKGPADTAVLQAFANHAALVVQRAQLQSQALRTQLLEEVDQLRRALLGAVSHDLRTPLAAMKVASSTLLARDGQGGPDSDRDELYELLDGEVDHLTRLVTGLLDLSRYQAGALTLTLEDCSVLDLVSQAAISTRPSLGERRVEIVMEDDLPEVRTDPLLIGQVIVNLMDNAHRHAPPGTPITVEGHRVGDQVQVSVIDRGPGVPAAQRDGIFEGFVSSERAGRAGLGLWISRSFVEAHGGRIWVDTPFGGGARFTFTLAPTGDQAPLSGVAR